MADSIVYEHDAIKRYRKVGKQYVMTDQLLIYKLVKSNGQVYSISTSYSANLSSSENFIIVKNLDDSLQKKYQINPWTHMKKLVVKWDISNNYKCVPTQNLDVFMYTNELLFVGTKSIINTHGIPSYGIWLFNLTNSTLYKHFTIGDNYVHVQKITPIGQKYFIIEPAKGYYCCESYVHAWEQLDKFSKQPVLNTLDKPYNQVKPVYMMSIGCELNPVDWSSSSIGHLNSCAFAQTYPNSQQIDFLDGNFSKIMSFNVTGFFADYKLLESSNWFIRVNANCLLYLEYIKPYTQVRSQKLNPGQANCYCWDFTYGKEIKFPNYKLEHWVNNVVPFRTSDNKVKYLAWENYNSKSWHKTYMSE